MSTDGEIKLGLALGAGCARGIAHIGVLQVFEEAGIKIDYIAGSSIGALIGGIYAAGTDLKVLGELASNLSWNQLLEIGFSRLGLVRGKRLHELLKLLTKDNPFDELLIPFTAVATDIESGDEVLINKGRVADGIMASISIPGIFVPVNIDGRLLVDGAVVNRLPVDIVREMGADVVVGVSIEAGNARVQIKNIVDIILQSVDVMQTELLKEKLITADLFIRPKVGHFTPSQIEKAEELVYAGREAALTVLPDIKRLLDRKERTLT